ncbi:hypothetical protein CPLU01_03291 [Colletotrichum plurivorum]|uniref:Mitochondrial seryl-tRNA synthetase n=1 Tax=Colletotrichum plurivorum TaxID=2175906 RepID=A0A8H6KT31_9PEZI|nr:hypothetical protein CPLU01_03291 [Colletotrichum plurivorum]
MLSRRLLPATRPLLRRNTPRTTSRPSSTSTKPTAATRILDRLPARFQRYTSGLRRAPVSHVVSFLILHEITAVVPLLGLFGLFHYTNFLPLEYVTEHWAEYVRDGVGKAERYFSRKGWFGFGAEDRGSMTGELEAGEDKGQTERTQDLLERWQKDGKYKIVVEVAIAWGITKALLPARILVSVWATPWFAGVMGRARGLSRSRK